MERKAESSSQENKGRDLNPGLEEKLRIFCLFFHLKLFETGASCTFQS